MNVARLVTIIILSLLVGACLDEIGAGPTPVANTQIAQLQTQIDELEHQLAACYAGHEIERGEEDQFLPPRTSTPGSSTERR